MWIAATLRQPANPVSDVVAPFRSADGHRASVPCQAFVQDDPGRNSLVHGCRECLSQAAVAHVRFTSFTGNAIA